MVEQPLSPAAPAGRTPTRGGDFDVVIVGGGPAGLSAALALGRARKRVLLSDSGPRRNAAAVHIHNFVTRDGTPPEAFRQQARQQLARYPGVEIRDERVEAISGARNAFEVTLASGPVRARRALLCTGMIDGALPIEGFAGLWGESIFQCPYCHGWEVREGRWGQLVRAEDAAMLLPFALQMRSWTDDVTVFMAAADAEVPEDARIRLRQAGIRLEMDPVVRLHARAGRLETVELANGARLPCDTLFAHPPQQQVALVRSLGLALDAHGFLEVDPMTGETSLPGLHAAGDLATRMQSAVFAAAAGTRTGAMINLDLSMDLDARQAPQRVPA